MYYQENDQMYVSVDCITLGFKDNRLHVLINKRKFEPFMGQRSLMGGFLRLSESLDETVGRVLYEYTGIEGVFMEQVGAYGNKDRDTGARVVSIVYYALIDMKLFDEKRCGEREAEWVAIDQVGELVFDHNRMLDDTLKLLRQRAATQPIGFNLLPELFTLPQLQLMYETIFGTTFDKRNFRKKMLDMDILEKQNTKDKNMSKRGAFYYKFKKNKYDLLLSKGYYFSV
jgi:ADP-ribose pyrophosphatase YjhB (NUDIX family)